MRNVFGLRLPFLPDFLEEHTLLGTTPSERLVEVLERQVHLVQNLWKWQGVGFSLRYRYLPERAAVDVVLLACLLTQDDGQAACQKLSEDLQRLLQAHGFVFQPIIDPADLENACSPFFHPFVAEVRQFESSIYLSWVKREAYVVYHFAKPQGTLIEVFAALQRLDTSCLINVHLEPTRLWQEEIDELNRIAAVTATVAEEQRRTLSETSSGHFSDPQAAQVSRLYRTLPRRFVQPFLMTIQVAGVDEFAVTSIAHMLGAACTATITGAGEVEPERGAFEVRCPRTQEEQEKATSVLHQLALATWGASELAQIYPRLQRLNQLTDASGAATAFRFPVAAKGGIPGIEVRQSVPDFDHGRQLAADRQEIQLGVLRRGGSIGLEMKDLARHGLICGLPGSGKTNTCLYILDQLLQQQVPFLVIEPAKTEYRGLTVYPRFRELAVFTAGDETTSPFRLNPFELLPGVRVEVHLESLNTAINAVMPQFGILPSIIEETLETVYARFGWSLTDRARTNEDRLFPMMSEFYREAVRITEQRGYQGEMHGNLLAAVKGRIGSLLRGSKGKMFNCRRSVAPEILFGRPVVLELDSLSDDTKALTIMFLMIFLREYRQMMARSAPGQESTGPSALRLQHVLLIEEAHRVLENVAASTNTEVSPDTRARAVRSIVDMLVEMRSYGQGILIAEQSPQKLAADAIRNTNLKITHMLPGREDRAALAASMVMDEEQERFLGKLRVGEAALFLTGFEKASFMTVPPFKSASKHNDFLTDDAIRTHMRQFSLADSAPLPFDGCRYCGEPCQHRDVIEPLTRTKGIVESFHSALAQFDVEPAPAAWDEQWRHVAEVCALAAARANREHNPEAAYCFLAHEIDFRFTQHMRLSFLRALVELDGRQHGANIQ